MQQHKRLGIGFVKACQCHRNRFRTICCMNESILRIVSWHVGLARIQALPISLRCSVVCNVHSNLYTKLVAVREVSNVGGASRLKIVTCLVQSHNKRIEVFVAQLFGKLFGGYHIRNATDSNSIQRLIGDNRQDRNIHISHCKVITQPDCGRFRLEGPDLNAVFR